MLMDSFLIEGGTGVGAAARAAVLRKALVPAQSDRAALVCHRGGRIAPFGCASKESECGCGPTVSSEGERNSHGSQRRLMVRS